MKHSLKGEYWYGNGEKIKPQTEKLRVCKNVMDASLIDMFLEKKLYLAKNDLTNVKDILSYEIIMYLKINDFAHHLLLMMLIFIKQKKFFEAKKLDKIMKIPFNFHFETQY